MNLKIAAAAFALTLVAVPAVASGLDGPRYACRFLDSTGASTAPCDIAVWSQEVRATMDVTSEVARHFCALFAAEMEKSETRFGEGWKLVIKSPYSGDTSIAFCDLPA